MDAPARARGTCRNGAPATRAQRGRPTRRGPAVGRACRGEGECIGGRSAKRCTIRMAGPDGIWRIRLSGYRPGDPWKYEGDPPGGPNCKVPAALIPHWRAYLRELDGAG